MKIFEIIDTNYTSSNSDFSNHKIGIQYDDDDPTVGAYAKVNPSQDDFQVKKEYHALLTDLERDAYYTYIKTISDNKLNQSNPFFPRVYNVDVEQDNKGKLKPVFDIEKLSPMDVLDNRAIYAMADGLFHNVDQFIPGREVKEHMSPKLLGMALRDVIQTGNYEAVKNTKLKQALKTIDNIIQNSNPEYDYALDLHKNNIMIRGTPHGPQLVITDPIS